MALERFVLTKYHVAFVRDHRIELILGKVTRYVNDTRAYFRAEPLSLFALTRFSHV